MDEMVRAIGAYEPAPWTAEDETVYQDSRAYDAWLDWIQTYDDDEYEREVLG